MVVILCEIILHITQYSSPNVNYILTNKENYRHGKSYIDKIKIMYYLQNNKYTEFKKCLNTYDYNDNYKEDLLRESLTDIPTIWEKTYMCGYYNLSIIFELLYNQVYLSDEEIKELNEIFYRCFYNEIQKCIVPNNRKKTIVNINQSWMLSSLQKDFVGFNKKTRSRVFYSIE